MLCVGSADILLWVIVGDGGIRKDILSVEDPDERARLRAEARRLKAGEFFFFPAEMNFYL